MGRVRKGPVYLLFYKKYVINFPDLEVSNSTNIDNKRKEIMKRIALLALIFAPLISNGQGTTAFMVTGSPDSYIGPAGQTLVIAPADGYQFVFNDIWLDSTTPLSSGLFEIDVEKSGSPSYWSLVLQTPSAGIPQIGLYVGATRWPFQNAGQPGMDFASAGRGENQLDGWFDILDLQQSNGTITSLAVDFYQHGDGYGSSLNPWEFGSIRYNSTIPITPAPEPQTLALATLGLLGLFLWKRR
jgi:hypothetical protein